MCFSAHALQWRAGSYNLLYRFLSAPLGILIHPGRSMPFTLKAPQQVALRHHILAALAIFLTSWLGMALGLSMGPGISSLVWAPSGVAVALVLHYGPRLLPAVGLGTFAAHLTIASPLLFACIATMGNVLEPLLALMLLRRSTPDNATRTGEVLRFCLLAGLAAPLVSAFFGNAGLFVSGTISVHELPGSFGVWWLGNALGVLVVGPFTLALLHQGGGPSVVRTSREGLLLAAGLIVASLLVFGGLLPGEMARSMAFVLVPFAVWAAIRMGLAGQSSTVLCVAAVAVAGTWNGLGPFAQESMLTSLTTLGAFLLVMSFTALLVGAAVADRRRVERRLGLGDERLRLLTENFPQGGVALLDTDLVVLLAGGLGLAHLGLRSETMIGRPLLPNFPNDVIMRLKPALQDALQGRVASAEAEFKGRIHEVHVQPVLDEDGAVRNILVISHDLTERVRAEEALAGSYVFLQRTLDSIPNPVFIKNSAGRYRFVNKAFCDLLQLRPGQVIGRTVHDIAPPDLAAVYHEKDRELLAGGGEQRYTAQATAADGSEKQLYFCKSLVRDPVNGEIEIVGLTMDISDLHRAQKALEASEARYRTLFEEMSLAALVADVETGAILDANRQACALWRADKEQLLGLKPPELVPPESREEAARRFSQHTQHGGGSSSEVQILTRDGRKTPVEIDSVVLQHQGRPALLALFKDISERKKLEQLRLDVEMMTRHDLKSPLNAVIGLPHVLLDAPNLTAEQQEIAAIIQEAGRRMLQIVNLSLGLYRMEIGAYELWPQPVDLLPLLRDIGKELSELMNTRRVRLEVATNGARSTDGATLRRANGSEEPAAGFIVHAEGLLCYSMLANLIKNAVEASPAGHAVQVTLVQEQEQARIDIHNHGAVPAAIRNDFFKKYVTMDKKDGTGLGAYSARLIAETQGGRIAMRSAEETGTTVTVWLPLGPQV